MTTDLNIKGQAYQAEPIDPGEDGTHAFRICGSKGQVYDVIRLRDGTLECSCPHYEARLKGNTRTPCKHGSSLVAAGLVPPVGVDPLAVIPPVGVCVGCSRSVFKADLKGGDCPACRAERESFDPATAPDLTPQEIEELGDDGPPEGPQFDDDPPEAEPWADFEPPPDAGSMILLDENGDPIMEGGWSEEDRWALGPEPPLTAEPSPAELPPGLSLLDWISHQAEHYELMGTDLGSWVGRTLRGLARDVRETGGATPAQVDERLEVIASGHEDDLGRLQRAEDVLARIERAMEAREHR